MNRHNGRIFLYGQLLMYFSAPVAYIGLVQAADIVSVDGERLELLLDLQGNADQLYDLIALDRDLLPINSGESADSPLLHYRWMR